MNVLARHKAWIQYLESPHITFDSLEAFLSQSSSEMLLFDLLHCGVIPEYLAHDSTQEKLWAKLCDIVVSNALNALGLQSTVLRTRGDSADVFATTSNYTLVADAKAFRLSRTAKNQKDFKIAALDDWRRNNTFACLVAPMYQYPRQKSQIYLQATKNNVTMLSYSHIRFLVKHRLSIRSFELLWQAVESIPHSPSAERYWQAIEASISRITQQPLSALTSHHKEDVDCAIELGHYGIQYWQDIIYSYQQFSQQEAINRLIKAEKIEQKIQTIQRAIGQLDDEP